MHKMTKANESLPGQFRLIGWLYVLVEKREDLERWIPK